MAKPSIIIKRRPHWVRLHPKCTSWSVKPDWAAFQGAPTLLPGAVLLWGRGQEGIVGSC